MRAENRYGFTMLEMLAVVALLGVLVALLLPSVQAARERARRLSCENNLTQLMMAVHQYEQAHRAYPPGTINDTGPIRTGTQGYHYSWIGQILPYIEQPNLYREIDFKRSAYDKENDDVRGSMIPILVCPSTIVQLGSTNYAGVHHHVEAPIDTTNMGVFFLNSQVRPKDVADGLASTFFIGEKVSERGNDLGWLSGTRATLRNTGTPLGISGVPGRGGGPGYLPSGQGVGEPPWWGVEEEMPEEWLEGEYFLLDVPASTGPVIAPLAVGGFSAEHDGGANFAFGDGNVRFVSELIDMTVYQQLGHRADGGLVQRDLLPGS